ncbi:trypsin-1-like [Belonocnema kinseyi]|uniref:trypsin-1-like n=1 Tax=Belonocnema kinseyi TaxID=2817044 RepID=UPI00143D596C|nr:trypsin-1-like [Belonocnema kinseyi]
MSSVYAKRLEAVFLCTHPKGPLMSYTTAAKYIKKSKWFVKKWVEQLFTENLNAPKILQIYERGLLRSATKMFGADTADCILQEDNDPKHRSRLCTAWKTEKGITTLDENVWNVLKRKLAGKPRLIPEFMKLNPLSPNGRIVGGQATAIEKVPHQVQLQVLGFGYCGGSILSDNYILTAGHCAGYPTKWISVRAGTTQYAKGGVVHRVNKVILHEKFSTSIFGVPINDVALLHLKTPLKLDETKQPIELFKHGEEVLEGSSSTITGWGALKEGGSTSDILQTVNVPIVSREKCSLSYVAYGGIPEGQICAAHPDGGKDACQGDSGGPLTIEGRLAGIVSWGNGCARRGFPGAYTEISSYRNWINMNAGL